MTPDAKVTTDPSASWMFREAAEAGDAVAAMLAGNREAFARLAVHLLANPPPVVVTCARGSSDHAATYGKYLIELATGIPVASAAPSIASLYRAPAQAQGALCIAISQSGRSPDLLTTVDTLRRAGAHVVAIVNDDGSPLAAMADTLIRLSAGTEHSVAATKSCIASMAAIAALVAAWAQDGELDAALAALPARLRDAWSAAWPGAAERLVDARNLFVIGRGPGFGVAQEVALKLKETCALHAEAFSAAEVRHGPMAIIDTGFPILAFATSDIAGDDVRAVAGDFAEQGASVLLAPSPPAHAWVEPLLMLQRFYRMANALAFARGLDPDRPRRLKKVTQTV